MRIRSFHLLVLLIVFFSLSSTYANGAELRGLWVDAWRQGAWTQVEVTQLVQTAKENRFNALILQVRRRGDVLYDSAIEPRMIECQAGFDPLAEAIRLGHEAGLEVHAWLTLFPVGSLVTPKDPNHPLQKHSAWLCEDLRGKKFHVDRDYYLDPGIKEVQDYLYEVCMEVAKKYPVDGIHLDYYRYPAVDWGYNPLAIARFKKETKSTAVPMPDDPTWRKWRQKQLTDLLDRIHTGLKTARPKAKLSIAAYSPYDQAVGLYFQDWKTWLKTGKVDIVVPMIFTKDYSTWRRRLIEAYTLDKDRVYIGIGNYLLTPEETITRINDVRKRNLKGFVLYSYGNSAKDTPNPSALSTISKSALPLPKAPVAGFGMEDGVPVKQPAQ